MSLAVNLRHLEAHNVELEGELPAGELDLDIHDETIEAKEPLKYELEVQKVEEGLLVQGQLSLTLDCKCVRCLKPFRYALTIENWVCHLPLQGEEKVEVLNDCVDLTPSLREDILLEFPQHPLCNRECQGLTNPSLGKPEKTNKNGQTESGLSAWAELNKLKL
jgi:uncharacterized metal-binding protein YceD (DUF177 family)